MKVTKEDVKKEEFKPYNIIISIESAEDVKVLYDMCGYNVTIPDMVFPDDKEKQEMLRDFLTLLRGSI